MSNLINIGTVLGGIGGFIAGGIAVYQVLWSPPVSVELSDDFDATITKLADAIVSSTPSPDTEMANMQRAITALEDRLNASQSPGTNVSLRPLSLAVGEFAGEANDCESTALDAFTELGAEGESKQNIKDWSDRASGSVSIKASYNGDSATIFCNPFESEIVIFASNSFDGGTLSIQNLWNEFYN